MKNSRSLINDFLSISKNHLRSNFATKGNYFDLIFLCGKSICNNQDDNRSHIKNKILENRYCFYAENVYEDFKLDFNLLTIEAMLNDLSTAILILLESMGTSCELGAFTYLSKNKNKVWVVNNCMFKNKPSFIKDGPLKRIESFNKNGVYYAKFKSGNIIFGKKIESWLKNIPHTSTLAAKPYKYKQDGSLVVKDLQFLMFAIFDYTKIFKVFIVDEFLTDFNKAFNCNKLLIKLSSEDEIIKQEIIKKIVNNIVKLLYESCIFLKKYNNKLNKEYYSLNYKIMMEREDSNNFSSIIFKKKYVKSREAVKRLSKIYNRLHQEGYELWKETI